MRITHEALWEKFRSSTVIQKAEQYSYFTLPYLMADSRLRTGSDGRLLVERDFQELGGLLVNNLSSKLTQILFPLQVPFFSIEVTGELRELAKRAGKSDAELRAALVRTELAANKRLSVEQIDSLTGPV